MYSTEKVNTVNVGDYNFVVTAHNRPFSNNFIVMIADIVQHNGQTEIHCKVLCTKNSFEPGRLYFVAYSTTGDMLACNTLN